MMAFFNAAGAAQAFKVGTLKHRDLDGNVVGSQVGTWGGVPMNSKMLKQMCAAVE
jgi:hypothetical protein